MRIVMERDFLSEYLKVAPISLALPRALECRMLSRYEFEPPILDVGCGDGLFASILLGGNTVKLDVGIDLSEKEAYRAQDCHAYGSIVVADVCALPFQGACFKTVLSSSVLEHVSALETALREISRVLAKDGKLIFAVPASNTCDHLFYSEIFAKIGAYGLAAFYVKLVRRILKHHNLMDLPEWERRLHEAGLAIVSHEIWHPVSTLHICDIFYPFGFVGLVSKKLFGRMVFRPHIVSSLLRRLLSRYYYEPQGDGDVGVNLLIAARPKQEARI